MKKSTKNKKETKKPTTKKVPLQIDNSYLRLPINKLIFELKENDNKPKSNSKNKIISMIDKAHNILYHQENIEGEDALNDIMNWLFIKCIQPIISDKPEEGKIDLLNKKHYEMLYYDDKILTETLGWFTDLKSLAMQSMGTIRNLDESNDIIRQMGEILKTHPDTKMIFTEYNFIKARKATTIQQLLNEVFCVMDIKEIESNEDVIGEIYEHIINGYVKKGSKLGQFFTPRKLMKLLLNFKLDRMKHIIDNFYSKEKGIILSDTCFGTGGWIVSAYNILKCVSKANFLLAGGEVKPSTFQYGLMNLILTLKKFPHDVHCDSSLSHVNSNKFHFMFTNPPFQTNKKFGQVKENFKLDNYTTDNKIKIEDVYILQDNSPPIQFLELDYYKLNDHGMCIIILPYGDLFSGSSYKAAREHFMKCCNITDIILFHGGIFTHTGIKTCALIFEKDSNGTKALNFIQANKECSTLSLIATVSIEDINKEPTKSWFLRNYLKDNHIEHLINNSNGIEWIEFCEIFTLEKGKIQSSEVKEDENGEGVFINCSMYDKYKKISNWKLDGENLFISSTMPNGADGGYIVLKYYKGKCDYANLMSRFIINKNYLDKINLKFVYYYLK